MQNNPATKQEESPTEVKGDWILRKVQEPTERLRGLQSDVDALVASIHGQILEMVDSRPERAYGDTALRRLQSLVVMLQSKSTEAHELAAEIADDVDRGSRSSPGKRRVKPLDACPEASPTPKQP